MAYTEVQVKKGQNYFYRTCSIREKDRFRKLRIYLGINLPARELKHKEEEANLILKSRLGKKKKLNEKEVLEEIKTTEWTIYHSRSSLIPPLTSAALYDLFASGLKPLFGDSWNQILVFFKGEKTIVCIPTKRHKKLSETAFRQLQSDPKIISKLRIKFKESAETVIKDLQKRRLKWKKGLSIPSIIKEYNWIFKKYEEMGLWGEPFPLMVYDSMSNYLEKLLASPKINEKERIDTYLLLITPTELSFFNREEKDLYQLAKKIHQDKQTRALFRGNTHLIIDRLKNRQEIWSLLQRHIKDYFWLTYDYFGQECTLEFFVDNIKELLQYPEKLNKNFYLELGKLKERQKEKFQELVEKKIITKEDVQIFQAAQDATLLMDFKKEKFNQVHWYINQLLKIAANKIGIDLKTLVHTLKDELSPLLHKKVSIEKIKQRVGNSVFYFSLQGNIILTGKKVDNLLNFIKKETKGIVKEVSGICASPGTIIGHVKVLAEPKESRKLLKGEILVTGMTTPEFVPAMKKAAAIITDEGGLTCHAAIVSRELGIPCIVGTKNATEVLKNDDLVEIHAGNGVVKVIRRTAKN